jgi:hypothetical protein
MQLSISIMLSPRLNYSTIFQHLLAGSLFQKYNSCKDELGFAFAVEAALCDHFGPKVNCKY